MKYGCRPAVTLLTLVLAACLIHSRFLIRRMERWETDIAQAEELLLAGAPEAAAERVREGAEDWRRLRTYLHITCRHDAVDSAEALYRRCALLIEGGAEEEALTALCELQERLRGLGDMERLSAGNIF